MSEYKEIIDKVVGSAIQDSGNRREFETGAVRDVAEGKGRFDLLPFGEVSAVMDGDRVLHYFGRFYDNKDPDFLGCALQEFIEAHYSSIAEAMIEVAIHFEQGALKYGERNWQKGIPLHCYIDSALRHYFKFLRGDTDERHDRAFMWNVLCAMWTLENFWRAENRSEIIDLWED